MARGAVVGGDAGSRPDQLPANLSRLVSPGQCSDERQNIEREPFGPLLEGFGPLIHATNTVHHECRNIAAQVSA
jgi:hypothetical protein